MFSSFRLNCYFNLTTQTNIDQGGVPYTVTTYLTNPTKVTISPASVHPSLLPLSPQPISAIPPMSSSSPVVGTTDLRNSSKISGAPAQLTMFYNGSVCV
ncbi:protein TIFY 6B-like [Salvia divinorum]|uniref:Protein TIFY 6B-like n=1 Tax=Salvia divinorum TaxID=28513 RepID=A0ABD1I5H5_SALDI